jgi:hypothetical protein
MLSCRGRCATPRRHEKRTLAHRAPAQPIDVWYSQQGEWVGLDSTVGGSRKLSHRLKQQLSFVAWGHKQGIYLFRGTP